MHLDGRDRGRRWGYQTSNTWRAGESDLRPVLALEQCVAGTPYPADQCELKPWPQGLWRIMVTVESGSIGGIASLVYGSGGDTFEITNILLPMVAFVPGYATVRAGPRAELQEGEFRIRSNVVPCTGYGRQRVAVPVNASAAPALVPPQTVQITALQAATYTPFGAPAPIAIAAGATVEVAGLTSLDTGRAIAWLEL